MTARGLPRRPTVGEWWTYAIVTLALTAVAFLSLRGTFLPDIKPEVYLNPWARLRLDLSTWLPDPYLGTQNYNLGLAPVDALVGIMQSLGVPAELSVRVLRLILMLVAGAGAYFLFGRLSPAPRSPAARNPGAGRGCSRRKSRSRSHGRRAGRRRAAAAPDRSRRR